MALPERRTVPFAFGRPQLRAPPRQGLAVAHRPAAPAPGDLAGAARGPRTAASRRPWLLLMPGLGGNADQFSWLAASWPNGAGRWW